ncbi:MAG: hypothetical protein ACYCW6_20995 [Candidatus Xenobia bacterium]
MAVSPEHESTATHLLRESVGHVPAWEIIASLAWIWPAQAPALLQIPRRDRGTSPAGYHAEVPPARLNR